jgi:glycosyltransferase involved in cell wall biosynthesis
LVLVEAMAAGRPVIASRSGGVPEVVVDGETGLLVSPESPAELAAAISRLVASPEEANRMGAAGRDRARSHFGAGRMAEQMTALYEELL